MISLDTNILVQTDSSTSGARLENLVASHLLKHAQFMSDSDGTPIALHYLKATSGKEIDFVLANDKGEPTYFIEVKLSDAVPRAPSLFRVRC